MLALCVILGGCSALGVGGSPTTTNEAPPSTGPATDTATASPTPSTLAGAFETMKGSVVRFEGSGCGVAQGSGFVIGDNLVVTAAHVVEGMSDIRVIVGKRSNAGEVIGFDAGKDVALVQVRAPLAHQVSFATHPAKVGEQVAALGYTLGEGLSFKPGVVNAVDRKARIGDVVRYGMFELDSPSNHGNSGGPIIDISGRVVGILDAGPDNAPGLRLAVPSTSAAALVAEWRRPGHTRPSSQDLMECAPALLSPDGEALITTETTDLDAINASHTLYIYFAALNNGDYTTAVAQYAKEPSLKKFTSAVESSSDSDFVLESYTLAHGSPVLWVRFTSRQEAGKGPADRPNETCTRWSLDYHFTEYDGQWLIDSSTTHSGTAASQPCEAAD
jgi:hypothetical protein